jgi:hypothetical protein
MRAKDVMVSSVATTRPETTIETVARIGGGEEGAPRRRRKYPGRPRDRGSHDFGTTLLDAALPGGLKQQDASRSSRGTPWQ